jgi:chromate transporter
VTVNKEHEAQGGVTAERARPALCGFVLYFLRLGALGFGGPVALANYMRRDLVETRAWLTSEEYENGLALAAACPGPLAYQLGVYCGYVRFGVVGGLSVAVAFGLAPFLIVTAAAALYVRFTGNWQLRALFYGIAPVVVALIVKACWNLGKRTLRNDHLAWTFAIVACAITVIVQKELALMFVAAGLIGAFAFARSAVPSIAATPTKCSTRANVFALIPGAAVFSGTTAKLFLFFFKTGLLVFGSGLVIVPFLKTQVVDQYHWLGNRQFLDSVAIGMISPGPVVITATFVGYLLNGTIGALAATIGIFSPPVLFTILATPILLRYYKYPRVAGFIRGVGVTVVGVLVGTTWLVGKEAIGDWLTAVIALGSLLAIIFWKKLPEPLVILAGGTIGLLMYRIIRPEWLLR